MKFVFTLLTLALFVMPYGRHAEAQDTPLQPSPNLCGCTCKEDPRSYHQHDGFYAHMDFGIGIGNSYATSANGDGATLAGASPAFSVALGGPIARNLIAFGEIFAVKFDDPGVTDVEDSPDFKLQSFSLRGIGPGLAYYFDPLGAFLSGTLLVTKLSFKDSNDLETSTDAGAGFILKGGKEWWVSENWGLGLLVGFHASLTKAYNGKLSDPVTWHNQTTFVSLSATYN